MHTKKIWLMGGLGNILFQILAFKVVNDKHAVKYINILVKKNFITNLLRWKIHEELYLNFIEKEEIQEINLLKASFLIFNAHISKVLNRSNKIATFYNSEIMFEPPFPSNIFGYFQSKDFLDKNKEYLIKMGAEINEKHGNKEPRIVLHYRYGDSHWARESEDYYLAIKDLIIKESSTVLVVTDSPKKAMLFFHGCSNIELARSTDALEDFSRMVSASKLYCAPSTFSWWAAHSLRQGTPFFAPKFLYKHLGFYMNNENITLI